MLSQPVDDVLRDAKRVLLCGIGGGYDFVCGLPLLLQLQARDVEVFVANLTFTDLSQVRRVNWLTPSLVEVSADSIGPNYFPEKWLSVWLRDHFGREASVFCLQAAGVQPLVESYKVLCALLQIDTILAIDGGVDSLLRGGEFSLGTPLWDALSLCALQELETPRKVLATCAFGAERWDKIAHADALERIADLTRDGACLGCETLLATTETGGNFVQAVEWLFAQQKNARGSIVASSLLSALRGDFGEQAVNERTLITTIWVSPLLALYWYFDLEAVANNKRFLPALRDSQTLDEAGFALGRWVESHPRDGWHEIPI